MGFIYENQGNATFLTYMLEDNDQLDSMSVGMITNNDIRGLMKAVFTQIDSKRYIKYNISAKIAVKQLFTGVINKRRLLGVLNGIVDAFMSAEEYMIDPGTILLDTQYMFSDVTTCETLMICLPVNRATARPGGIAGFIKEIMFSSRFDQTEDSDYVAKIISYLNNATSAFSLERFKALLNEVTMQGRANSYRSMREAPPAMPEMDPVPAHPEYILRGGAEMGGAAQRPVRMQPPVQPATPPVMQKGNGVPRQAEPFAVPGKEGEYGFAAPGVSFQGSADPSTSGQAYGQTESNENKITLFYLLQHYNKENAEAYKAQKERRKAGKAEQKAGKKAKGKGRANEMEYAVPDMGQYYAPAAQAQAPIYPSQENYSGYEPQMPPAGSERYGAGRGQMPDFGDTVYVNGDSGDDSETLIMGMERSAQQVRPQLIRKRNNERIPLDRNNFRIGRDAGFNDYPIVDNKHVGHSHCHIITRNGEFFVVDDNSKNHTFVNGSTIPSGSEIKLAHGYVLGVADEEFEFRLY